METALIVFALIVIVGGLFAAISFGLQARRDHRTRSSSAVPTARSEERPSADYDERSGMAGITTIGVAMAFLAIVVTAAYAVYDPFRAADAAERQRAIDVERGAHSFVTYCAACHGMEGQGLVGPNIHLGELAKRHSLRPTDPDERRKLEDLVNKTVTRGRPPVMPAWGLTDGGALNHQQINEITMFVLSDQWSAAAAVAKEYEVKPAAAAPAAGEPEGLAAMRSNACLACHALNGQGATGGPGPDLTGLASRPKIAGVLDTNRENLIRWLTNPLAVKPGTTMPPLPLSDTVREKIADYLLQK
ncbi:MAG: c-type cytochrome [Chloroflexi bacterium]|nr:c-type cytochrome [Chloroflexota bacterium]